MEMNDSLQPQFMNDYLLFIVIFATQNRRSVSVIGTEFDNSRDMSSYLCDCNLSKEVSKCRIKLRLASSADVIFALWSSTFRCCITREIN